MFFGSPRLFSGTLLPPNHFLVAVKSDRLKPFLETSCKDRKVVNGTANGHERLTSEVASLIAVDLFYSFIFLNSYFNEIEMTPFLRDQLCQLIINESNT